MKKNERESFFSVAFIMLVAMPTAAAAHVSVAAGVIGPGSGRAGAIVALVLALTGMVLGGLALVRSRRSG